MHSAKIDDAISKATASAKELADQAQKISRQAGVTAPKED